MLRLAELQPGDIVCDPLAGTGAILIESAIAFPQTFGLCADHHNVAIQHCFENTDAIGKKSQNGPTGVVQWDSTKMPLRSASMDVIVTDMPFGKRIGTKTMNRDLYPKLVREMSRIVRPTTGRAILLTQDYKNLQKVLESDFTRKCWKTRAKMFLKLGNLSTYIYCLRRTSYIIS
jgi:tRNA G10  N-methylase Trm11